MTLLITGGAGFIGSNFIQYYHSSYPSDRLVCLDKLTYAGSLANLAPLAGPDGSSSDAEHFRFVKGDICDRDLVFSLFESEHPDVVVNFAAETHVDRSIADPDLFLKSNVLGTGVLLDAIL